MSLTKHGFRRVTQMLNTAPEILRRHLTEANEENAQEVVRVAKVLVPQGKTGRARAAIKAESRPNGGQLLDFGPLSAILEGGTGERQHKSGKSTGRGPKLPFVNPAMKSTAGSRKRRSAKAVRDAYKEASKNG